MDKKEVSLFRQWFDKYVKSFYSEDTDIQLHVEVKERHTYHVCDNIVKIGQSLGLSGQELAIAETAALFHDVGRFRQYQDYRTFNDRISTDHAALSAAVLEQHAVLQDLDNKTREIVTKAVLYHNRRSLPEGEDEQVLLYSKLVRDADKLDIFAMIVGDNADCKMVKSPELAESVEYSTSLAADILANRMPRYEDLSTSADQMLFRCSWVYGLYFPYSAAVMLEKQYINRMLSALPQEETIGRVAAHLTGYLVNAKAGNLEIQRNIL